MIHILYIKTVQHFK